MKLSPQFFLIATIIVLFATQGACTVLYVGNADSKANKDKALLLSPYSQTIARYSKYDWSTEQQPKNLIKYCEALFEMGVPIPPALQEPDAPHHIAEFSQAYLMLLNGRVKESEAIFIGLTKDKDRSIWGFAGLLELAIYTKNIASMKKWLDELQNSNKNSDVVAQISPLYTLHYEFHMANFEKVEKILKGIESSVESLPIRIHMLLRENRFGDAQRLIDRTATSSDLENQNIIISAQAELILARNGFEKSTEYLKKMSDQFPEMWKVRMLYASHLTGLQGEEAREIAIKTLLSVSNTRKRDLATQLVVINVLLDLRDHDKAGSLITGLSDAPTEFYYYNLILAKMDFLMRNNESLRLNLSEARAMFPMEPDGLWFTYRLNALNGDYEEAIAALKKLLRLDPHDPYALASLAQTYIAIGRWREARAVAISVLESRRYIDKELRSEMDEYRSRAAAKLN